jgi:ATP-dependent DNA helicase RecQ
VTIHQIRTTYWGHTQFRSLQEEIIQQVMSGKDTLALLPTGGGKSICFQVPSMAVEGICLVVSPLIALMKDQVEQLKKRNIPALCITSGMGRREIDITLDNCVYGKYKFLYVSPERLGTPLFIERFKRMKVNFIAIDEAHCISQWGYDFRPAYLQIAAIRELKAEVPVIALTATATPEVVVDIQRQLQFKQPNVLQKSFERKNIAYVVLKEEDKHKRLLKLIASVPGTGVIYVRNRRKTKEVAEMLLRKSISADYYHAGLAHEVRNQKQQSWSSGKTRIMVSTNAFGMGIDQPHVRFVAHLDLPDSLEAYFQEAGRAGRDEQKAYAVMLYNEGDVLDLKRRLSDGFPAIKHIKSVYTALCNYFQIAYGSGQEMVFDFDIVDFCQRYAFENLATVYTCLGFMERIGHISTTEGVFNTSKLNFTVDKEALYRFQVKTPDFDLLIKTILRSYGGLFDHFVSINEKEIAQRSKFNSVKVKQMLQKLDELNILVYLPQNNHPKITFLLPRIEEKLLQFPKNVYHDRKKQLEEKASEVRNYVHQSSGCRSLFLLAYFGETTAKRCGVCDLCLDRNKMEISDLEYEKISSSLQTTLTAQAEKLDVLIEKTAQPQSKKVIRVIRWLLDHKKLREDENGFFHWMG